MPVSSSGRVRAWPVALAAAAALSGSAVARAQTPPPVQGTVALEGTMKKFYRGVNVLVVATMDGVEHTYHFARDLVVHGGKGPEDLKSLQEGTQVVVHYSGSGTDASAREIDVVGDNQGLKITEGRVTRIDRGRKEITVRFPDGASATFHLTDRAAAEAKTPSDAAADGARVVIYYTDEGGRRVAHYFKVVP